MISKAQDVDCYLRGVPEERRPALERLRALCLRTLSGYEECMEYGLPCYKRNGAAEVGFASQKQYIALYVLKQDVVDGFRGALSPASIGKGCIRFRKPAQMDFALLERLLERTRESDSKPC